MTDVLHLGQNRLIHYREIVDSQQLCPFDKHYHLDFTKKKSLQQKHSACDAKH
ncbi:MAG: hypothetical protein PUA53_02010 [Chlamydia suis]|uniref:hypothetical protein n=1 Tax=Chlamydia suis TaxID=83559 RepID=UPI0012FB0539|nr:hypothetical protein [Chlamydia suis]MDD6309785.1 hypothetical protein [Chlamydia suis]MDD7385962.1 hypothetical protein [Chlamydia suis]MDY4960489.1 hypothetical protein [Chlamydia suis]